MGRQLNPKQNNFVPNDTGTRSHLIYTCLLRIVFFFRIRLGRHVGRKYGYPKLRALCNRSGNQQVHQVHQAANNQTSCKITTRAGLHESVQVANTFQKLQIVASSCAKNVQKSCAKSSFRFLTYIAILIVVVFRYCIQVYVLDVFENN